MAKMHSFAVTTPMTRGDKARERRNCPNCFRITLLLAEIYSLRLGQSEE